MGCYQFDYQIVVGKTRPLPLLEVMLFGPTGASPVLALIDSGAEHCIFPESKALDVGIDLPAKANYELQYGGSVAPGKNVDSYIYLGQRRIRTNIVFVERRAFPYALLGRNRVFSQFNEVVFLEKLRTPRVEFRY